MKSLLTLLFCVFVSSPILAIVLNGANTNGGGAVNDGLAADVSASQCGLYAAYGALRQLGIDVEFSKLLTPRYLGDSAGSSFEELLTLIEDHNAYGVAVSNLGLDSLRSWSGSAILFVRRGDLAKTYNHFVLVLKVEPNQVTILDAPNPPRTMSNEELKRLWSGKAILLDNEPIRSLPKANSRYLQLAAILTALTSILLLGHWIVRRVLGVRDTDTRTHQRRMYWVEACVIAGIAIVFGCGPILLAGDVSEFLKSADVVAEVHVMSFVERTTPATAASRGKAGSVIIDSRLYRRPNPWLDYGGVILPFDAPISTCREVLQQVSLETELIVVTDQVNESSAEILIRKLRDLGYREVVLCVLTDAAEAK